ncbi:hypothetical protein ACFXGI_36920 [Streptomyces sp. NPDC059355]|uniref:hypothetical protein n=1 Tax=Streptomyces sp. NPDC059355 TaxID=3346811 RepID=UPI0036972315
MPSGNRMRSPALRVHGAAAVIAQRGGVALVAPDVVAAVLEEVGAGVVAVAGVDTDGGAGLRFQDRRVADLEAQITNPSQGVQQ